MACVLSWLTITRIGSTGGSFFSLQSARPTRPPRMRASKAMTRYFMGSKVPEFLLQQGQSAHRGCFRAQHARAQSNGRKACFDGRFLLDIGESALRSDQHRGVHGSIRDVCNAQPRAGREQQSSPARLAVFEQLVQADRLRDLRPPIASTLLARGNCDRAPVLDLPERLLLIE